MLKAKDEHLDSRTHNPKVVGSNPIPVTKFSRRKAAILLELQVLAITIGVLAPQN